MDSVEQDRQTIERVKAGNSRAFKELIEKYKDEAFTLACTIVKDHALAEDILQEVFLKVFDKIKTFNYASSFYTWLYRIVVNRCYNELRKKKISGSESVVLMSDKDAAAVLTDNNHRKKVINHALNQMKADESLVLRLFYLSELKIEEVVEVTGFSQSKVKVSLHRGRKNLAELLKKQFGREIEDL